jgi:hypothetical protein
LLGISDRRPWPRPKPSQWRGILAACFMFRFDDHLLDQTGHHLLRNSEISSSVYSFGWRYIVLVDHRSCFPVSKFRMNHPYNARSQIHHSTLIDTTCFTLSKPHRMVLGTGTLTYRYRNSGSQAYYFMLLKWENRVTNPNLTPILMNSVVSTPVNNEVLALIGFGTTSEGGFGLRNVQRPVRWRNC